MKISCNRQIVHIVALACGIALCAATKLFALPPAAPTAPAEPELTAEDKYVHARHLLERASNFETVIATLRAVLASDPGNAKFHNLLACALVDRAASITYAARKIDLYGKFHERYVRDLARWQAAQRGNPPPVAVEPLVHDLEQQLADPASVASHASQYQIDEAKYRASIERRLADAKRLRAIYVEQFGAGSPPPDEPILRTFDDAKIFKLTRDQAKSDCKKLVKESESEFGRAESLAASSKDKAEFIATHAWAKLLVTWRLTEPGDHKAYSNDEILKAFQSAVDLDPDSAERLREQADAMTYIAKVLRSPSSAETQRAISIYRRALGLQDGDRERINAQIFLLTQPPFLTPVKWSNDAQIALQTAIRGDSRNAFLRYVQAALLLEAPTTPAADPSASKSEAEALASVQTANAMPKFSSVLYTEAIPSTLAGAYNYGLRQYPNTFWLMTNLSKELCGFAAKQQRSGDTSASEQTLLAVVAIGNRLRSVTPSRPGGFTSLQLDSHEALQEAYAALAVLYQAANRPDDAKKALDAENAVAIDAKRDRDLYLSSMYFGYVDEE